MLPQTRNLTLHFMCCLPEQGRQPILLVRSEALDVSHLQFQQPPMPNGSGTCFTGSAIATHQGLHPVSGPLASKSLTWPASSNGQCELRCQDACSRSCFQAQLFSSVLHASLTRSISFQRSRCPVCSVVVVIRAVEIGLPKNADPDYIPHVQRAPDQAENPQGLRHRGMLAASLANRQQQHSTFQHTANCMFMTSAWGSVGCL